MSRFEVAAPSLTRTAASCDAVAQALAQVVVSLRAQGHPDTGRSSSTAHVAAVVDQLSEAVQGLGAAALADGDALRAAAATYLRTEAAAVRPP